MSMPEEPHAFDIIPLDFNGMNDFSTIEESYSIAKRRLDAITSGPTYEHRLNLMNRATRILEENNLLGDGGWMIVSQVVEPGHDAFIPGVTSDDATTKIAETAVQLAKDPETGAALLRIIQETQIGFGSNFRHAVTVDVTVSDYGAVMNIGGGHFNDNAEMCDASTWEPVQVSEMPNGCLELDQRFASTPLSGFYAYQGDDLSVLGLNEFISMSAPNDPVDQWDAWNTARELLLGVEQRVKNNLIAGSVWKDDIVSPWKDAVWRDDIVLPPEEWDQ